MALLNVNFLSEVMNFESTLTIITPEPRNFGLWEDRAAHTQDLCVLYLLHGYNDDHNSWLRKSRIEHHITKSGKPIIAVMPGCQNFFYTDMAHGWPYYTYIAEEVPRVVSSYLRISQAREKTFIAGLSMGGYGAFKIALRHPEHFSVAASFSGVLDVVDQLRRDGHVQTQREKELVFGPPDTWEKSENDVMYLLERAAASGKPLPRLYQSVGLDDFLYENNQRFRKKAEALEVDLTYYEEVGVAHEWPFWDREVKKFIDSLPIPRTMRV
nr:alpha/beta hydrolase family protein [Maliibacterium massiliense]